MRVLVAVGISYSQEIVDFTPTNRNGAGRP
jgi:hypothetical protein